MRRTLYDDDHEAFRESFRKFAETEIAPYQQQWDAAGIVPRELFTKAGRSGFIGMEIPGELGGGGVSDFRFNAVIGEEVMRIGAAAAGLRPDPAQRHLPAVLPCVRQRGAEAAVAARDRLRRADHGDRHDRARHRVGPGIDFGHRDPRRRPLRGQRSQDLHHQRDQRRPGDHGREDRPIPAAQGHVLLVLERGMPGFERGRNLDKLGQHAQDTAELSFTDVPVPATNLLGQGFTQLVANLPRERLSIAIAGVPAARTALEQTLDYVKERTAFGQPIGSFQNSRFVLAEIATEVDIAQHYADDCVRALNAGELTAADASKAKWWCTELQGRVADRCLQLHGGYGYMNEYPIARAYADARITRIYGGTTEIMKEVIGRSLGL